MIERQRVVLSFIDAAGGATPKTHFMKWLFLLRQEKPEAIGASFYEFVPYKFGPFSFQAYRDIASLENAGYLSPEKLSIATTAHSKARDEIGKLPKRAVEGVADVLRQYGKVSRDKLLDDVYARYPWYASRSELRERKRIKPAPPAVYTVGYEGRSIDGLLDHLLRSKIRRLIDVRKNAMSRKYGFAGKTIARVCSDVDIEYVHIPALGIPSSMRTDLSSQEAYEKLFDHYEEKILSRAAESIGTVADLCAETASALMCFEASSCQCHRGRLAPQVAAQSGLEVKHL
jgi:uncharacterized protein (DUF488 family)